MKAFLRCSAKCSAFILVFFLAGFVQAQDQRHYPIGQVADITGSVEAHKNGNSRTLKKDDPVYLHSEIKTGNNAKVLILLIDDTQISLAEDSSLVIDEYIIDPYDSKENKAELSVSTGAFYWVSGLLSKREQPQVNIKTAAGTIGIRGTEFWAGRVENGYGAFVNEGMIDIKGSWGQESLNAGQGVFIPDGAPPKQDYWNKDTREEAIERVTIAENLAREEQEQLQRLMKQNIRKRHDYRSMMFPYKEDPFQERIKGDDDQFFTDEFEEFRRRN